MKCFTENVHKNSKIIEIDQSVLHNGTIKVSNRPKKAAAEIIIIIPLIYTLIL